MSVATQSKERPIRFNATEVLAVIEGRKTQSRLVIKDAVAVPATEFRQADYDGPLPCPFGKPGDRLWVQETWNCLNAATSEPISPSPQPGVCAIAYAATEADRHDRYPNSNLLTKWRLSDDMPRWASRITLEIAGVRVERLNDISEDDAKAEGVEPGCLQCGENCVYTGGCGHCLPSYRDSFAWLWQYRNGPESWAANPWVWVVEFRVVD